jgi:ADP-ribosyl-[dinitrogen reductase] hydrolase
MTAILSKRARFEGCILAGAIGDAWGSCFENVPLRDDSRTFYLGKIAPPPPQWMLTDDTWLTLATCEILSPGKDTAALAAQFLQYYKSGRMAGMGASTLKAMQDLSAGIHWRYAGTSGEYSAGNGAAMRIAPFAFWHSRSREDIRDACRITHKNEEAYIGALAVVLAIRAAIAGTWTPDTDLFDILIPQLPDTHVRDRMIAIQQMGHNVAIKEVAALGNNGYVVNSVPLALFAASKAPQMGLQDMFAAIIAAGGDTDTNTSIAGQVAGALLGPAKIPAALLQKLQSLPEYVYIDRVLLNCYPA